MKNQTLDKLKTINEQLDQNPEPIKERLREILEDQRDRKRLRTSLAKMVEHVNDRWSNMPPTVEESYNAFFENEDFWSDHPEYRWSTPYLWSEKGTA